MNYFMVFPTYAAASVCVAVTGIPFSSVAHECCVG